MTKPNPTGFTLIELLLSLALSTLLLVIVFGAIEMYAAMRIDREQEQSLVLIGEAVSRQMRSQLRTVVPPAPEPSTSDAASETEEGEDGSAEEETIGLEATTIGSDSDILTITITNPDAAAGTATNPFRGSPVSVTALTLGTGPRRGLWVQEWFLLELPETELQVAIAESLLTEMGSEQETGLVWFSAPAAEVTSFNELGTALDFPSRAVLLAPEATELSFEYFDGSTWITDWDSSILGSPPVAVAVSIAYTGRFGNEARTRTVIRLPLVDATALATGETTESSFEESE